MLDTSNDASNRFLCEQHRRNLKNNPEQAALIWNQLILSARKKAMHKEWHQAAAIYGRAFEIADILFQRNPAKHEVNRYIKTVTEHCYTLRYLHTTTHISILVQTTKYQLKSHLLTDYSNDLLKPILDVAFSPMTQVNRWMKALFNLESAQQHLIH